MEFEASKLILKTLDGIGVQSSDYLSDGAYTMVARRRCTDKERKGIVEKYLRVPT